MLIDKAFGERDNGLVIPFNDRAGMDDTLVINGS